MSCWGVWLAGGGGVRLGVGVSLGPCCWGLGVPLGLVGRVGVRGVALPGGLCLGPVSSGGPGPQSWSLWPCLRPFPVPVRWLLWQPGSSPGGEGVVVRRAAAFPAASSVGVARSPRVGVPSIPRVVSGGWWVCAGVIRTPSDACFGGACLGGAPRPRESCGVRWGWGGAGPSVVVCPSWVWVVAFAVVPFSSVPWSPLLPLPGSWVVSCPHVVSLPAPCPYWCLPSLGAPSCLLARVPLGVPCPPFALVLLLPGVVVAGWGGGAVGQGLGVGGLESFGGELGGCRGGGGPARHRGGGPPMPLAA